MQLTKTGIVAGTLALWAAAAPAGLAQDMQPSLTAQSAMTIVHGCMAWAAENDLDVVIAVYDEAVNPKAFMRMDGAQPGSIAIAQWKGESAANFRRTTREIADFVTAMPAIGHAPGIAALQGGVSIRTEDGAPLGGVGVSGASAAQDEECAVAGVEAAGLDAGLPGEE